MENFKSTTNNLKRPVTPIVEFEKAIISAELSKDEQLLIDHIRFIGTFTQPILRQSLRLPRKPPVLSTLCETCRKIGLLIPDHFEKVRIWSEVVSTNGVRWDGNLICCVALNIDGDPLTPEAGTAQFHNFAVHPELFQGLDH